MLAKIYALGLDLGDLELCRSAFAPGAMGGIGTGELLPIDEHLASISRVVGAASDRCRRFEDGWLITERRLHVQWVEQRPA